MDMSLAGAFDIIKFYLYQSLHYLLPFMAIHILRPLIHELGGAVYMLSSLPLMVPGFGQIYKSHIINGIFKISYLAKFIGFCISASTPLFVMLLASLIHPPALSENSVLFSIFLGCVAQTLRIFHNAHLMKIAHFDDMMQTIIEIAPSSIVSAFQNMPKREKLEMARAQFADHMMIDLLSIGLCYGLIVFIGTNIGIFDKTSETKLEIQDGISGALATMRLMSFNPVQLNGALGLAVNAFFSVSTLFYITFYVSLTSKLIDEPSDTVNEKTNDATSNLILQLDKIIAEAAANSEHHESEGHSKDASLDDETNIPEYQKSKPPNNRNNLDGEPPV